MKVHEKSTQLTKGERITWYQFGDPAGFPILYFHGTPGSAWEAATLNHAAQECAVNLVAVDRPGLGSSPLEAAPSMASRIAVVAEFVDRLGWDDYATLGWSGGAPYALATGARQSPLIRSIGLLAPQPPSTFAGWIPMAARRAAFTSMGALADLPNVGNAVLQQVFRSDGHGGQAAETMTASLRRSVNNGGHANAVDSHLLATQWNQLLPDSVRLLEQASATIPVWIVAGGRDLIVRASSVRALAATIPHSILINDPRATHLQVLLDDGPRLLHRLSQPR